MGSSFDCGGAIISQQNISFGAVSQLPFGSTRRLKTILLSAAFAEVNPPSAYRRAQWVAAREKDLEDVRSLLQLRLKEVDLEVVRLRLGELQRLIDDSTLLPLFEQQVQAAGQRSPRSRPGTKTARR